MKCFSSFFAELVARGERDDIHTRAEYERIFEATFLVDGQWAIVDEKCCGTFRNAFDR